MEELPWLGSGEVKAAAAAVGRMWASQLPCGRPSLAQHRWVGEEALAPLCSTGQQVLQGMCFPIWIVPCTLLPFLWVKQDNFASPLSVTKTH